MADLRLIRNVFASEPPKESDLDDCALLNRKLFPLIDNFVETEWSTGLNLILQVSEYESQHPFIFKIQRFIELF